MTDKVRSSPPDASRPVPEPDADLDAALWPDPPDTADPADPGRARPGGASPVMAASVPRISARERIRRDRERSARRRRRIRVSVIGGSVLALAAATTVAVAVTSGHGKHAPAPPAPFGYTGPYAPVTLNADNSVTMAWPGITTPVLDVYEDFQCPACRTFENADGAVIQQLADQKKAKVVYYPFTVYTAQPQLGSSIRAWAAARCAPPGRWVKYHNTLYANQPAQTASDGFPVSQLIALGKDAGITSPAFAQCVRSQQYAPLDEPASDQIINTGLASMPALTLNGKPLGNNLTPSALRKLILTDHR